MRRRRPAVGARVVEVPLGTDFSFPADRILAAIGPQTRLLFLTSPNNPTGLLDPAGRHRAHRPRTRRTCACSSTRPTPTSPRHRSSAIRRLAALPNIFIGRTFAKAYGLAGVRAGVDHRRSRQALEPLRHIVPTVQPQHLRRRWRSRPGWPTWTTIEWYLGAGAGRRRPCSMRRSARPAFASGRARQTSCWPISATAPSAVVAGSGGARRARPRQVSRPRVPGMRPHHDRRSRAHPGVHSTRSRRSCAARSN